ncbi:MAG: ABC transporter substrate-binding protein, partial [Ilumatobacteraceae bacterium]
MRLTRGRQAFAVLLVSAAVVSACSSDKKTATPATTPATTAASATTVASGGSTATTTASTGSTGGTTGSTGGTTASTGGTETTAAASGPKGGTITIGVEQEWDCLDYMGSCGGSTYGAWSVLFATTARPFDFVQDGDVWKYKASNLLTGEPTVATVGGKQVVTYKINPKAVWSDGKAITATDFKYTWSQVTTGTDIYDTTTFRDVESIDDSDPATAVLTFSKANASWKDLYESYGIYPAHLLDGKDRDA